MYRVNIAACFHYELAHELEEEDIPGIDDGLEIHVEFTDFE